MRPTPLARLGRLGLLFSVGLVALLEPRAARAVQESGPAVPEETKPRLLVLEMKASLGIDPDLARLLAELLTTRLRAIAKHEVLSHADLVRMLDVEQQKQLVGCDDEGCLAELAGALGARYLVAGSLSRLGGKPMVTVKLVDSQEARLLEQISEELPPEESEYAESMRVLSYRLLGMKAPARVLPPTPWYQNPWLWGAAGVVAVGASVGGYFLLRPPSAPDAGLGKVVLDAP